MTLPRFTSLFYPQLSKCVLRHIDSEFPMVLAKFKG